MGGSEAIVVVDESQNVYAYMPSPDEDHVCPTALPFGVDIQPEPFTMYDIDHRGALRCTLPCNNDSECGDFPAKCVNIHGEKNKNVCAYVSNASQNNLEGTKSRLFMFDN